LSIRIHRLEGGTALGETRRRATVEVRVVKVYVRSDFILGENYVNPETWQPLIYNFRHYFGLGTELRKTFRAEI